MRIIHASVHALTRFRRMSVARITSNENPFLLREIRGDSLSNYYRDVRFDMGYLNMYSRTDIKRPPLNFVRELDGEWFKVALRNFHEALGAPLREVDTAFHVDDLLRVLA